MATIRVISPSSLADTSLVAHMRERRSCASFIGPFFTRCGDLIRPALKQAGVAGETHLPSTQDNSADVALFVRIAQNDSTAFEELYDKLSGTMFSLVIRIVRSRSDAEDVLQIGFQQVWCSASQYASERGSPFAWIATIMRHKAIDALRVRHGQHQRIDLAYKKRNEEEDTTFGSNQLVRSEQHAAVRKALSRLSAHERKSIELAFFDGLTHVEIAHALGYSVGTIKARIRRGMLKLRPSLATVADFPVAA